MRIGIFDPYLDDLGGGEKYMMTIAECLSRENKVDIFWDNQKDLRLINQRFPLNLSKIKLVENIFSPKTSMLKRLLKTKKYDVIFILSDGSIPLVMSKKLLIHIQQPLQKMQTRGVINKIKLGRVSMFFCNSQYTKSFLDKRFFIKTKVLYPPVKFYPKNLKKENIILHVGRFRVQNVKSGDYKKQKVMIDVFKEMVNKGLKNWRFVLAVSVNSKDKTAFDAMKKSAENFPVEFLVNKSNNELWEIYSRAKIYWHASGFGEDLEKHPEFAEHFGISTVEAMGAGAIPVVINAGGQKEMVVEGENGFLWDSLDELKSKTLRLISNDKLLNDLSKKAKEISKKFNSESFCKEIEDMIL